MNILSLSVRFLWAGVACMTLCLQWLNVKPSENWALLC